MGRTIKAKMAGTLRTASALFCKTLVTGALKRSSPLLYNAGARLMSTGQYEHLIVDKVGEKKNVGLIQLNRPKALNALCSPLMEEMSIALKEFDEDQNVGCIVLTGSERAFAAGADIKEMGPKDFAGVYKEDFISKWTGLA